MWLCLQSAPYKSDLWTLFNAQRGISQLLGDKSKYKNSNEQMTLWFALTLPLLTSPYDTMYIHVPNVTHIVDRKWVWTENDFNLCAKLYFAGLPTLWQRKRNKVGCQQESQVKAPGGGEKFFLLVKVGTAFVFVLFVILILRRRNWAKTTNRTQAASKCNQ